MDFAVKRSRTLEVVGSSGEPFSWVSRECRVVGFMTRDSQLTLEVELDPLDAEVPGIVDAAALEYLKRNNEDTFRKRHNLVVSDAEIEDMFRPSTRGRILKVKVSPTPTNPVDVYDADKALIHASESIDFLDDLEDTLREATSVKIAFGPPIPWAFRSMAGVSWRAKQIQVLRKEA